MSPSAIIEKVSGWDKLTPEEKQTVSSLVKDKSPRKGGSQLSTFYELHMPKE